MGYTRAEIPLDSVHGIAVTGGSFPAEMWRLFMEPALDNKEAVAFPEPRAWPEWKPFTRGEYALTYDPSYTPETTDTEETETEPEKEPEKEPEAPFQPPTGGLREDG
jgi:membrane peptidoglycan carboxypeptidase